TACTRPTARDSSPLRTGKYFFSPSTRSSGTSAAGAACGASITRAVARSSMARSVQTLGVPACRPVPRPLLLVGRAARMALRVGVRAARGEGTAGGQGIQRRHDARDLGQPLAPARYA